MKRESSLPVCRAPGSGGLMALALIFVLLVTTFGVQWLSLTAFSLGGHLKYFHLVGLVFGLVAVLQKRSWWAALEVQRSFWVFGIGLLLYLVFMTYAGLYLTRPYFSLREVLRQWFGVFLFLCVSSFIFRACVEPRCRGILMWTTVIASGATGAVMFVTLMRSGTNPLDLIASAFASADPRILIYGLFKASFTASADDPEIQANLRHGILSSLLAGLFISIAFYDRRALRGWARMVVGLGGVAAVGLVIFSLSRSVLAVLLGYAAVVAVDLAARRKYAAKTLLLGPPVIVLLAVVLYSDVGGLMEQRFLQETGSYESRLEGVNAALARINENPLFPGEAGTRLNSSHNLVLDAWAGAGMVAALGAIMMFGSLLFLWGRFGLELLFVKPRWRLSLVQNAFLGLGLIPLVRFLTAGSGTLHAGEWVALAAFAGGYSASRYASRSTSTSAAGAQPGLEGEAYPLPDTRSRGPIPTRLTTPGPVRSPWR